MQILENIAHNRKTNSKKKKEMLDTLEKVNCLIRHAGKAKHCTSTNYVNIRDHLNHIRTINF